ncbi:MAG: argininosuccinate lyase, partial [Pararheinheimera sp.]|nr:argininosuccinate lyase [Rheinheimera sp.]
GELVLVASKQQKPLEALALAEMQQVSPLISEDVYAALTIEAGLAKRASLAGTSPDRVKEALDATKVWFEAL